MKTKNFRPLRIVCAEDDPADQYLLRKAVKRAELTGELRVVDNGEDLLEYLTGHENSNGEAGGPDNADLILLDLNMPLMDGRATLMSIRQNESIRHIPVIVLSTSDGAHDVRECYRLGASSYIVKPRSFDRLVETMTGIERYWGGLCHLPEHGIA